MNMAKTLMVSDLLNKMNSSARKSIVLCKTPSQSEALLNDADLETLFNTYIQPMISTLLKVFTSFQAKDCLGEELN